jgi:peptidoglycan/xylan/chitin deacetylase (PgdA/CDA1 family)
MTASGAGGRTSRMDNPYYEWAGVKSRPSFSWPQNRPVAVSVLILLEHVELHPPSDALSTPLSGGLTGSAFPYPNLPLLSHRDYGFRVGVFRILDALAQIGAPAGLAFDAMTAERLPWLVDHCHSRDCEFIAHGISVTRIISSRMSEAEERAYVDESLKRLSNATGAQLRGWIGPEQSESARTPLVLDAAGLDYVLDWPNDDQPYLLKTPRQLVSLPTHFALDDAYFWLGRSVGSDDYAASAIRAFDALAREGAHSGRSLVLVVRPWLTGQPFRMDRLEAGLKHMAATGQAWFASPGQVADAFRSAVRNPGNPAPP